MIRLLAVDMDGTCLNDKKYISKRTIQALCDAANAGITVVPTTGRTVTCLPDQLLRENFYRYAISSNGAVVTDLQSGKNLYEAKIPYRKVLDLLRQGTKIHLGISAHIENQFVIQGHCLRTMGKIFFGKDGSHTVYAKNIADILEKNRTDVEEIQLFYFSENGKEKTKKLLKQYPELLKAASGNYVELYSSRASKGNALAALAEYLNIAQNEIACVGDAENDLSMFRSSGLKFAMGNGIDALKNEADVILPSNNEDGVAYAVYQYLLKNGTPEQSITL